MCGTYMRDKISYAERVPWRTEQPVTYHVDYLQQRKLKLDYKGLGVVHDWSLKTVVVSQQLSVQAPLAFTLQRD